MRKAVVMVGVFLLLAGFVSWALAVGFRPQTSPSQGPKVGEPALDFTLKDMQGESLTLSRLQGKVVVLNFWATWCPPCRAEMPSMERLNEVFGSRDFALLAVNVEADGKEIVGEFLKSHPHSFQILLDEDAKVQQTYGVFRFPETFIIDKNGVIVKHVIGARDWADTEMLAYIKSLLEG